MIPIAAGTVLGISIFLVGLWTMTQGLKTAAGQRLRWIIEHFTANPWLCLVTRSGSCSPRSKQQCCCGCRCGTR